MARYQILSWHGIPTGVKAKDSDGEARENLPRRFQVAVDAVATATGRTGTKEYLAGWQWSDPLERPGTAREIAQAVATELAESYLPSRVKALCRNLEACLTGQ
ncbi:MAG: virulence factor [Ardenticatenaceae bacterium]|nr:virulence factor [Ardenticatenaceae bacterium]